MTRKVKNMQQGVKEPSYQPAIIKVLKWPLTVAPQFSVSHMNNEVLAYINLNLAYPFSQEYFEIFIAFIVNQKGDMMGATLGRQMHQNLLTE